jgi:hypothetical protein
MKMLSAKMNKESRFNKHFASCLIINKNGRTELIGPKQIDDSLCQQSENGSDEETLKTTKNEGNQSFSHILEEIRISNQTLSEMEQIKHMEEDTDKLGLTLFEMEQKPHVVNYHEIKLTMTSDTFDLNDKCLKAETIPQIGEKYLASQTMEEGRLESHDQESKEQKSHVQESHAQESHAQESHIQESHIQESPVQESHIQESPVQESHDYKSHDQEIHDQESHDQEIKLPMTAKTLDLDLNIKSMKAETIPQIGEKYLASQTMKEGRLGCHDQESQEQTSHDKEIHDQESHVQESHVHLSHVQKSHDQESLVPERLAQNQAEMKVNDINKETKSNTILKGHKYKTDSKENEDTEYSKVQKKEMVTKKGLRVMDTNSNNCILNNSNSTFHFQMKNENNKTLMDKNLNDFNLNKKDLNISNSIFGFQIKNENNKTLMDTNSNDCKIIKKDFSLDRSNSTVGYSMKNENKKIIDRVSDLRKIRRTSKVSKCVM